MIIACRDYNPVDYFLRVLLPFLPTVSLMSSEYANLLRKADLCVKCGQCLSSCPTYLLQGNEVESPRGRISLIQGLFKGTLDESDPALRGHLDHCLGCGNCESSCPSGVDYLNLLDQARATKKLGAVPAWQLQFFSQRRLLKASVTSSQFLPKSALKLLPDILFQAQLSKPAGKPEFVDFGRFPTKEPVGRVALFVGCVGSLIDASAINLTRQLLVHFGYEVIIPETQTCCGALHRHEGYAGKADGYLHQNLDCFNGLELHQVLYFASGCGAQLHQFEKKFTAPIMEVTAFMAGIKAIETFRVNNTDKIVLHSPCSLRYQTQAWPKMRQLLQSMLGDQLTELPENDLCCGSAGLHQLKYPDIASSLLKPKLDALASLTPDILLTANTGCAMHFAKGIEKSSLPVKVMHPAEWIAGLFLKSGN